MVKFCSTAFFKKISAILRFFKHLSLISNLFLSIKLFFSGLSLLIYYLSSGHIGFFTCFQNNQHKLTSQTAKLSGRDNP